MCILGIISHQDQKIKSNNYHLLCAVRLINILLIFCYNILTGSKDTVSYNWTYLFCLSTYKNSVYICAGN